jgi:hypothetical protein
MDPVTWDVARSPLLKSLKEAASAQGALSIRLVLDAYEARKGLPNSYTGRLVGTIGPAGKEEPRHSPPGRLLGFSSTPFNRSYAVLDEKNKTLAIDLANSLPIRAPGGAITPQLVELVVAAKISILSGLNLPVTDRDPIGYVTLGTITRWDGLRETRGGIVDLPLGKVQTALARQSSIALFAVTPKGLDAAAIWEHPSGMAVALEPAFLRLNPQESRACRLRVTQFGRPVEGFTPDLKLVDSELPPIAHANTPASALCLPVLDPTDKNGSTVATIRASAPTGKPEARRFIDGQVYFVGGTWEAFAQTGNFLQAPPLTVLVFDEFQIPANPQWDRDIKPILINYARLFPIMRKQVGIDLVDLKLIKKYAEEIIESLQPVDVDDKNPLKQAALMPPSRDLSDKKRTLLLSWVKGLNTSKRKD